MTTPVMIDCGSLLSWSALAASWSPLPIAAGDDPFLAAGSASLWLRTASRAVPVLATTLQSVQVYAALGADWRRDAHRASLAQRDQQVCDNPWAWGTAIGQHDRLE